MEPHDLPVDFQQYRTLLSVSESICAHRDLKALLQELSKRLRSLARFEFIGLHLHDPSRNVMQRSERWAWRVRRAFRLAAFLLRDLPEAPRVRNLQRKTVALGEDVVVARDEHIGVCGDRGGHDGAVVRVADGNCQG